MRELRLAVRTLAARPSFSLVAILTLGLTIGAATAVFSLFDAALLRPFPFPEAHHLVRVRTNEASVPGSLADASVFDYRDWKRETRSFASLAISVSYSNNLTGDGPAQAVSMTFASPELFEALRVSPARGALYTSRQDVLGGDVRHALLSDALWRSRFGGDPGVVGRTVQLRGETYAVAGVMPPGFSYPGRTDVWAPLMARYSSYPTNFWQKRDLRFHEVLGRLRDGVTAEQAAAELSAIAQRLAERYPETNRGIATRVLGLREVETQDLKRWVLLLGAAVGLLLLMGCVNVANLFLARAAGRAREFALRAALGSGRWRLARQLLAEGAVCAVAGGVVGLVLAGVAVRSLPRLIPVDLPYWLTLELDGRVLAFAMLVSAATAVSFGLAPLAQNWNADLAGVLQQGAKGSAGGSSARLRRWLVTIEVALSVTLLVGAGLMVRSFARLAAVDSGIRKEGLLVATVQRFLPNLTKEQRVLHYALEQKRMRLRLAQLPGVIQVAAANDVPYLNQPEERRSMMLRTRERPAVEMALRTPGQGADVSPGFFAAAGIPLLEGRDLTEADDAKAPHAIILNRRAADLLFPGRSAVGQEVRWGNDLEADPWMRVIGVVGNTIWNPAERQPAIEIYWSYLQYPTSSTHLMVRTPGDPEALAGAVRRVIAEVNPDFAVERVLPMAQLENEALWQQRLWGVVLAGFAGVALTLAAVGLYGVMSFLVAQRTREIGIRMALGAVPREVLLGVLRTGAALTGAGILAGLAVAFVATRFLTGLLFGVAPADALTFTVAPLLLALVALAACAVPSLRAARLDPLTALRED